MKIRSKTNITKASILFTDRQEPRDAFWNKIAQFRQLAMVQGDIQVLSYYGIGGIGKSCLLRKLMNEMDEKAEEIAYLYVDFSVVQTSHETLESMKNRLMANYSFEFPLFELGLYNYYKKLGIDSEAPETRRLTEKSRLLSILLKLAGEIPVVGIASKIFSYADEGLAYISTYLKQHRKELMDIEYMDIHMLQEYLPILFGQDLSEALQKENRMLVIFLDTYENLVNLLGRGEAVVKDAWIRSEKGLIQNTANTMWVIAGREKLQWERFDSRWTSALEQHILGNLSENDSDWFLKQSMIDDEKLRKELYQLTNGTPVYLDLCVNRYHELIQQGQNPSIELFGKNQIELIERFVRYLSDTQKDMVFFLANLQAWDDDLVMDLGPSVISSFSISSYEKCKELSFVSEYEGQYHFHKTVSQVLIENGSEMIKKKTASEGLALCRKKLEKEELSFFETFKAVEKAVYFCMNHPDGSVVEDVLNEILYDKLFLFLKAGCVKEVKPLYEKLLTLGDSIEYLKALVWSGYSDCLMAGGYHEDSIDAANKSLEYYRRSNNSLDIMYALMKLGDLYDRFGNLQQSKQCYKELFIIKENCHISEKDMKELEGRLALFYADHLIRINELKEAERLYRLAINRIEEYPINDVPVIFINFAQLLCELQQSEEALTISKMNVDFCLEELGEDHLVTLAAVSSMCTALEHNGRLEEAHDLLIDVYEKECQIRGEYHPSTLITLNNIAYLMMDLGNYQDAYGILSGAYENTQELIPKEHEVMQNIMGNLARALCYYGELEEALKLEEEVLKTRQESLSKDHPLLLDTYETINFLKKAIEDKKKTFS